MLPLPVVSQQAVDVAARDPAVGAHRAVELAVAELEQRTERTGRAADMHLVTFERHGAVCRLAAHFDQDFVAFEDRVDVEHPEAVDLLRWSFDAVRIGNRAAEHLVAATDTEHEAAAPQMRLE